jgi:hypothetical protein
MADESCPKEYLDRHIEMKKVYALEEIARMISKDYPFKTRKTPDDKEINTIEFVVCSTSNFNHGMQRLSAAMALFPELKHIAKSIIEEMFYPESENE